MRGWKSFSKYALGAASHPRRARPSPRRVRRCGVQRGSSCSCRLLVRAERDTYVASSTYESVTFPRKPVRGAFGELVEDEAVLLVRLHSVRQQLHQARVAARSGQYVLCTVGWADRT